MPNKQATKKHFSEWNAENLRQDLYGRYGPLVGGQDLAKLLGFQTAAALRQAEIRVTLPIAVFSIENRRGRFAFTEDVANWLASLRHRTLGRSMEPLHAITTTIKEEPKM